MNSKLNKKPRFYFNSQKAARTTIFWLYVISFILLIMAYTSLQTYKEKGFISVPQKGSSVKIHGPGAITTIYFYVGSSVFFFGLGCYFSFIYIRIRNVQRRSSKIIVPEKCIPEEIICPSCLKKRPIYFSSNLICPKCKIQMEEINGYFDRHTYSKRNKPDSSFNTESILIILSMIIVSILLLKLFDIIINS